MTPPAGGFLSGLHPGGGFVGLLLGLCAFGLVLHALLLRRLGAERLDRWTQAIEGALFCLVLAVMLVIAGIQIVLRNFFHSGILWGDPVVRTLVLWLAFLGAATATSRARHLHIDVLQRSFPAAVGRRVRRVLSLGAAVCCAFLANGALSYLQEEYQMGSSPFLGIPSWAAQSILLWGFAFLCYRFLVQVLWPAPAHEPVEMGER
jgi:TRAP-type C4-dicarboxylate transport system permease small subunit